MTRYTVIKSRYDTDGFDVLDTEEDAVAPFETKISAEHIADRLNSGAGVDQFLGWLYENGKVLLRHPDGSEKILLEAREDNDDS